MKPEALEAMDLIQLFNQVLKTGLQQQSMFQRQVTQQPPSLSH